MRESYTALERLHDDELCIVVVNGREYEAQWCKESWRFFLCDADRLGQNISWRLSEIEEWWPNSVKL